MALRSQGKKTRLDLPLDEKYTTIFEIALPKKSNLDVIKPPDPTTDLKKTPKAKEYSWCKISNCLPKIIFFDLFIFSSCLS